MKGTAFYSSHNVSKKKEEWMDTILSSIRVEACVGEQGERIVSLPASFMVSNTIPAVSMPTISSKQVEIRMHVKVKDKQEPLNFLACRTRNWGNTYALNTEPEDEGFWVQFFIPVVNGRSGPYTPENLNYLNTWHMDGADLVICEFSLIFQDGRPFFTGQELYRYACRSDGKHLSCPKLGHKPDSNAIALLNQHFGWAARSLPPAVGQPWDDKKFVIPRHFLNSREAAVYWYNIRKGKGVATARREEGGRHVNAAVKWQDIPKRHGCSYLLAGEKIRFKKINSVELQNYMENLSLPYYLTGIQLE